MDFGSSDLPVAMVIFDCDGVLVDSEPLAMAVLLQTINDAGVQLEPEMAYKRFLGCSVATIDRIVRDEFGVAIPPQELDAMRHRILDVFRLNLQPIAGIHDAIAELEVPFCVASSSYPERVRLSLELTGLLDAFEPNVFSATMVERGKPAPDLFLYAAHTMGFDPGECLVVEDSPAGIQAAKSAGMRVCGFVGGSHAASNEHQSAIRKFEPDFLIADMLRLNEIVASTRTKRGDN